MPCKKKEQRSTLGFKKLKRRVMIATTFQKTKHACIVEAHESTRKRLESTPPEGREDHIAGKGYNSMTHHNLVHKLIPMPQTMNILDAKAAVDKEWKELETIPAWQLDKVKSNMEVFLEAQRDKKKVHFATLTDICRLWTRSWNPSWGVWGQNRAPW